MENRIDKGEYSLAGFTLIELCVVLVIVGIILTFALPQFAATKEHLLDKEAKTTLSLIRAAEKIYKMEYRYFYPANDAGPTGSTEDIALMNSYLKLSLPDNSGNAWTHKVDSTAGSATSTRRGGDERKWSVNLSTDDDPVPTP